MLVFAVVMFGWALIDRARFNSGSRDLSLQLLEQSLGEQNFQLLEQVSGDALAQQWRGDSLQRFFLYLSDSVGEMTEVESIVGGSDVSLLPWQRRRAIATYDIALRLQGEPVQVFLQWQRQRGRWSLSSIEITADALQN